MDMIKPYTDIQYVRVESGIYKKACEYSNRVTPTKKDVYLYQDNEEKKNEDALYGKICEYASYQILKPYSLTELSKPDFMVYNKASWDSDLKNFNGNNIAVKSQRIGSYKNYGLGWVFQDNKNRHDPILNSPNSWVSFVLCGNLTENKELKCLVFPLYQVKDLKYRLPKPSLIGDKRIVDGTKLPGINLSDISVFSDYI